MAMCGDWCRTPFVPTPVPVPAPVPVPVPTPVPVPVPASRSRTNHERFTLPLLLCLFSCIQVTPPTPRPPNIVLILADDLGYGDLGCYGQQVIRTPEIDSMAAQGMRFTQCYAGSTVCAPSRCVLMTGLHTGHCLVRGNAEVALRAEDVTVAEVLKGAGYVTGIIGKWGLGEAGTTGVPNLQGFDEWYGYLNQGNAHNYYPEFLWRNQEKERLEGNVAKDGVATTRARYSHDLFVEEALSFIERHRREPFFLYLALTLPHANNELGRATGDGMEVPDHGPYADRDWPGPEKGRAAMIDRLDRAVASVLARLRALGLDEETIVFFTSDNGPHSEGGSDAGFFRSSGPLRGIKRSLHEGGIRVPMIVRWPGKVPAAATSDIPWGFWDFLPTAAELAGAEVPEGLDGVSILPALRGGAPDRLVRFYWEFHEGGFSQAARIGRWKGVRKRSASAPVELYDLDADPGEERDVAVEHPDVVSGMEEWLEKARVESEHWPVRGRD